jgi:hypothetical protein
MSFRTKKDVHYVGGERGGTLIATTFFASARRNSTGVQKARQALIRHYGKSTIGMTAKGSSGHTTNPLNQNDPGDQPQDGIWTVVHLTIANNSSDGINFGVASGIAAVKAFCEIKRNYGTPVRELNELRIAQIGGATYMGLEIDRNSAAASAGVTVTESIAAGDLLLTFTTDNSGATADVQVLFTILQET